MSTLLHERGIPWWKTRFAFVLMCLVVIGLVLIVADHSPPQGRALGA